MKLKVLDLFSGIGGFSLGLERTNGFETIALCEINKWCQKILSKHWPNIPILEDITKIGIKPILSVEDSPALTYPTRADAPELPENIQVFGGGKGVPFAWYDHSTQSWRTWQRCLIEGWAEFSETWPRSGMIRNGIAYQREELVPHITETEAGYLPTITAREGRDWSRGEVLARLDRGDGTAKRICALSPSLRNSQQIVGLNPSFAEWMMGYPIGWTDLKD